MMPWGAGAGVVTSVTALKAHRKGTFVTDVTSPAGLCKNTLQENANPFYSSNSRYFIQIFSTLSAAEGKELYKFWCII